MIRHATTLDVPYIVEFVKRFYHETSYSRYAPFCAETVAELTEKLSKSGILLIATHEDKIVGILGLVVAPFLFNSNVLTCSEVIWYVTPEQQKSGIGIKMIQRADEIRRLRGCTAFQMMRLEESPSKLDEVFLKLGFHPTEHCFTKVD